MSEMARPNDRDLDRLDVDELKRFLARRWKLILASAFGCVLLAGIVCVSVKPIYTATSQIFLDPHKQHVFGTEAVNPDSALDSSVVDSQIPIILSTRLLAKVIAKEHLAQDPEFAAPSKPGLLDRLFGLFLPAREAQVEPPSFDGIDPALAPVITRLFNRVDVIRVAKSNVLSISVSSHDPAKAMRLSNSVAETYVEDQVDVHARSVQQAATFFEQRLGHLRDQVRESERAVADFRKAHDLTTTTMDSQMTVGEQQLQNLNEQLARVSADTAEALAKYQQAVRFKSNGSNLDTLPEVIRSQVIIQLRAQQADLSRREADLSATYGPAYPAITQIHAQRGGLERAVTAEIKRLTVVLKNDYEVAKAREASFRKTITGLTDTSGGDNDIGIKLRELERANLANKALFENFLNRAKLTQEQSSFEEPDARLISPALEPSSPSSPKIKIILPVSGVVGLLLGLGLAALVDAKRRRFVASPSAQDDAFILARIPTVGGRGDKADLAAFMEKHPDSAFAREIEDLADKLSNGRGGVGRVVTIAPMSAREGATTLTLCLAQTIGAAGRRVLLIDAVGAGAGLSRRLAPADHRGLAEVIAGETTAGKAVIRGSHFAFLPAGGRTLSWPKSQKALRAFLQETRSRFDLILIDAPAFVASDDAMALGGVSDGLALVASWEQLMRDRFITAIDRIADKPVFAGIILNRTGVAAADELAVAS